MDPRPELCAATVQPLDAYREKLERMHTALNRAAAQIAAGEPSVALRQLRLVQGLREELEGLENTIESALLRVPGTARGALTVVSGGRT